MTARLKGSKETTASGRLHRRIWHAIPAQCASVRTNATKLQGDSISVADLADLDDPEISPGYGFKHDLHRMILRLDTPTFYLS